MSEKKEEPEQYVHVQIQGANNAFEEPGNTAYLSLKEKPEGLSRIEMERQAPNSRALHSSNGKPEHTIALWRTDDIFIGGYTGGGEKLTEVHLDGAYNKGYGRLHNGRLSETTLPDFVISSSSYLPNVTKLVINDDVPHHEVFRILSSFEKTREDFAEKITVTLEESEAFSGRPDIEKYRLADTTPLEVTVNHEIDGVAQSYTYRLEANRSITCLGGTLPDGTELTESYGLSVVDDYNRITAIQAGETTFLDPEYESIMKYGGTDKTTSDIPPYGFMKESSGQSMKAFAEKVSPLATPAEAETTLSKEEYDFFLANYDSRYLQPENAEDVALPDDLQSALALTDFQYTDIDGNLGRSEKREIKLSDHIELLDEAIVAFHDHDQPDGGERGELRNDLEMMHKLANVFTITALPSLNEENKQAYVIDGKPLFELLSTLDMAKKDEATPKELEESLNTTNQQVIGDMPKRGAPVSMLDLQVSSGSKEATDRTV